MSFETALDVIGFLGIALLSVPVLSLDRKKKSATDSAREIEMRKAGGVPSALDRVAEKNRVDSSKEVQTWTPRDRICLWTGYALVFLSGLGRIFT